MEVKNKEITDLTITAMLTAIGILIPAIMPIRLVLGTASYTLASHVPLNIAMFRSPISAFVVAVGTTIGFILSGMNIFIVLRALSHLIYASFGALYLKKFPNTLKSSKSRFMFSFIINLIHGISEVVVVYSLTMLGPDPMTANFLQNLFLLVGLGTLVHGMVDFEIAYRISSLIQRRTKFKLTELAM